MNKDSINQASVDGAHNGTRQESGSERWKRLYAAPGGALMGWLVEHAAGQGMDFAGLAKELRVTVGYLAQLQAGIRDCAAISRDFAAACGVFLGVPAVVVLIVAGQLTLVDLVSASDFDRWVERTVGHDDGEPVHLACGAQVGVEGLRLLPHIVEALQAAASVHARRARMV